MQGEKAERDEAQRDATPRDVASVGAPANARSGFRLPGPRSLVGRLALATLTLFTLAIGVLLWQSHARITASIEAGEVGRIRAIAATLAPQLDGPGVAAAAVTLPDVDAFRAWSDAPATLLRTHEVLEAAARQNRLSTPIELVLPREDMRTRLRNEPEIGAGNAMQVLATSDALPGFRHGLDYLPTMAEALRGAVVATEPYADEQGTWISAFAPVFDAHGEVAAILVVDEPLDPLLEGQQAYARQLAALAFLLLVVAGAGLVLMATKLTTGVTRLAQAARSFGRGDLHTPIRAEGDAAEVRYLANALEAARQEIAGSIQSQQESEMELAAALQGAREATRVKSQFLANMSHELRTPMNAILGYSEMLIEECEDDGSEGYVPDLKKIHRAGHHLLALINDILDLSKVEAGKMEIYIEDFSVTQLVSEVFETVRPLVERNGNVLVVEIAENVDRMQSDQTRVRQILLNLLSNAAKFTKDGRVTLGVRRERGNLCFAVNDTGIGMTADQLVGLFDAFTQADASTTREFGGTGLGLALSRQFAQLLGGRIEVESVQNEGSLFTVVLPRRGRRQKTSSSRMRVIPMGELSSELELGSGRVLVVDDDPRISELIAATLRAAGYDVETAPDGPTALAAATEVRPDVIVFGLLLSGTDGFGALSDIKAEPELAEIPVVLVTMDGERSLGYALGATDYVEKSDPEQLAGAVGRQVGKEGLVLVVDDDAAVRDTLKRALERSGYEVETAADGEEGLDRVVELRPSLVLLDLMMPKVDGFEVLERLREDDMLRDLPVLCFTARDLDGDDRARLQRGMAKVLQKGGRGGEALLEEIRRQVASHIARTSQLPPAPQRQQLAP